MKVSKYERAGDYSASLDVEFDPNVAAELQAAYELLRDYDNMEPSEAPRVEITAEILDASLSPYITATVNGTTIPMQRVATEMVRGRCEYKYISTVKRDANTETSVE